MGMQAKGGCQEGVAEQSLLTSQLRPAAGIGLNYNLNYNSLESL